MATVNLTWNAPASGQEPDEYWVYKKETALGGSDNVNGFGSGGSGSHYLATVAHGGAMGSEQTYTDGAAADGQDVHYCVTAAKGTLESQHATALDGDTGKVFTITTAAP